MAFIELHGYANMSFGLDYFLVLRHTHDRIRNKEANHWFLIA